MKKSRLLLLEDDINLSETVCEFLEEHGYEVKVVYDGKEAEEVLYEERFDVLLLDVNVPFKNGFAILKDVRAQNNTAPAIFLTSLNGMEDLSLGYQSGCDDYIRKPFELKELLLRIETLLKREFFHAISEKVHITKHVEYDAKTHSLYVENKEVFLQNKEAKLLKLFLQKQNEIIPHEVIMCELWDYEEVPSESALRTYIKNLRKIIGKDRIVSVKKLGYKFTRE
ncbi:MAG: response regulator transcription factor [Sulfurospirillaceae bacterium]|nr:response regulator transcription factor [Sulfurospirillaceae bacterium]